MALRAQHRGHQRHHRVDALHRRLHVGGCPQRHPLDSRPAVRGGACARLQLRRQHATGGAAAGTARHDSAADLADAQPLEGHQHRYRHRCRRADVSGSQGGKRQFPQLRGLRLRLGLLSRHVSPDHRRGRLVSGPLPGASGVIDLIDTYWLYFLVGQYPHGPLGGLALTLILAVLGLLFAFPLGLVFGIARVSPWRCVRWPVSALIQVVRGTPLLMVIFWAYFFLPSLTGQNTDQFWTMLTALVVFDAAYLAEIIRAGIQGIGKGQTESARSLGFSYLDAMRLVILPQVVRNMLPSLVNQFVATIKETSLGYIIGLTEVSFIATQINTQVLTKPAEVYLLLGLTYFILCFGLSRFAFWLERHHQQRTLAKAHA
ncbi:amino acid ABC transporter permease [Candidatus Accumulibacter phosphatis]|uniref:Amino acid ABC transporter permease n=1 Tax=Candidatus Accumulibacter contiguus TaxID=2954381 RepID=A0ABX1TC86_9PROT|nr:amino acid ABC transporter permease [Candidatus Accumulibacter contiguus]